MNNTDLKMKVRTLMDKHCNGEGSVRPVDVLLDLGYLKEKDLNAFLSGLVPYLEKVCTANLSKLKTLLDEMSSYAKERGYKESVSAYKHKGKVLRFSTYIEKKYSARFTSRSQLTRKPSEHSHTTSCRESSR